MAHRAGIWPAAALAAASLTGCDNVATWSKSQAQDDVRAQLQAPARFSGVRYVRRDTETVVCGRVDGRRFVWAGDYQSSGDGDEVRFYTAAETKAWRERCEER